MKKPLFTLLSSFFILSLSAQSVRSRVNEGNRLYEAGKFGEAETLYRGALEEESNDFEPRFNLGNVLYRQGKFAEAAREFQRATTTINTVETGRTSTSLSNRSPSLQQTNAQYNLGNALFQNKEYGKSIEAYKQALRQHPQDEDARHNLVLAQAMLAQQPPQEQQMQQQTAEQMLDVLQQMEQQPKQQRFISPKQVEKEW
jgi:tetratricopeptide (TPR) repeat protein